jgi:antitoxin VapB
MALNIKSEDVERLVEQLAAHTGETRTEAVRRALEERLERTRARPFRRQREADALAWLRAEVWPTLPAGQRGRRLTRAEEDAILGYGPEGA